jgi:hypothetical protein
MKTYLTITYYVNSNRESRMSFVRPRSAKKPTERGAARMIAAKLAEDYGNNVKPSDVSICRVEEMCYANH